MNYYKAIIQYDGTNYCGFQWQKELGTVQNDFNQALYQLLSGKVTTMGASRTDTGVHAVEQIVKISAEQEIDCQPFLSLLNQSLPSEIRCLSLSECAGSFRPASDHVSKEYRYLFSNTLKSNSLDQRFIVNHPYQIDIELMMEAAGMVVGKRDFQNFCSAGSNVKTTVREITRCEVSAINPHTVLPNPDLFTLPLTHPQCFQLRIEGRGFLKHMVRHLMRALWLVGGGMISPDEFEGLLNGPKKTKRLWMVAPPNGLYLYGFKTSSSEEPASH